jgi:hypothetical protein
LRTVDFALEGVATRGIIRPHNSDAGETPVGAEGGLWRGHDW